MRFVAVFSLALAGFSALVAGQRGGCANCGDLPKEDIIKYCEDKACSGFRFDEGLKKACLAECDKIVYQLGCCADSVCETIHRRSSPPTLPAHPGFRSDESLFEPDGQDIHVEELHPGLMNRLAVRAAPFDRVESTEHLRSLNPAFEELSLLEDRSLNERSLEKRDGELCCAICNGLERMDELCPPNVRAAISAFRSGRLVGGLAAALGQLAPGVAILACKAACTGYYGTIC